MLSRILSRSKELTVRSCAGRQPGSHRPQLHHRRHVAGRCRRRSGIAAGVLEHRHPGPLHLAVHYAWRRNCAWGRRCSRLVLALSIACGFVIGFVPAIGLRQTPLFTAQLESVTSGDEDQFAHARHAGGRPIGVVRHPVGGRGTHLAHAVPVGAHGRRISTERRHHRANLCCCKDNPRTFYSSLLERTRQLDGVQSVALASTFPLVDSRRRARVRAGYQRRR